MGTSLRSEQCHGTVHYHQQLILSQFFLLAQSCMALTITYLYIVKDNYNNIYPHRRQDIVTSPDPMQDSTSKSQFKWAVVQVSVLYKTTYIQCRNNSWHGMFSAHLACSASLCKSGKGRYVYALTQIAHGHAGYRIKLASCLLLFLNTTHQ